MLQSTDAVLQCIAINQVSSPNCHLSDMLDKL